MFSHLSDAKAKGGIFVAFQAKAMLKSKTLEEKMNATEQKVWQSFRNVVEGFLGNKKDPNYKELVANLIK